MVGLLLSLVLLLYSQLRKEPSDEQVVQSAEPWPAGKMVAHNAETDPDEPVELEPAAVVVALELLSSVDEDEDEEAAVADSG